MWSKYDIQPRPSKFDDLLGDVDSRLPKRHVYLVNDDNISSTHECTHGINANIRNGLQQQTSIRHNAFYIGYGVYWGVPEFARFKLKDVADLVPSKYRDSTYRLYMINMQRYWNDRPLYILDECCAYLNGTKYGVAKNWPDKTRLSYSWTNGTKFLYYTTLMNENLSNEEERASIRQFWQYCNSHYESLLGYCPQADTTFFDLANNDKS